MEVSTPQCSEIKSVDETRTSATGSAPPSESGLTPSIPSSKKECSRILRRISSCSSAGRVGGGFELIEPGPDLDRPPGASDPLQAKRITDVHLGVGLLLQLDTTGSPVRNRTWQVSRRVVPEEQIGIDPQPVSDRFLAGDPSFSSWRS